MKEKYIIFTGSFNPVTNAHLFALKTAMQAIGANRGYFVPVCDEYLARKMLKAMQRLALPADFRIRALNTVCEGSSTLFVSDYEVKNHDSTHTYKTLMHFTEQYPEADIYFLNGADKLKNIPHWNDAEALLRTISFVLFDRGDIDAEAEIKNNDLLRAHCDKFTILPASDDFTDVSASAVRERFIAGDQSYRDTLPSSVADMLSEIDLADYPEPSIYDWIDMKLSGGPFDKVAGHKKVYELNKELFQKTDLSEMLHKTCVIGNTEIGSRSQVKTEIVTLDESYDKLIAQLKKENLNPVIISEACYFRAGGGYDQGKADTLEERLCLVSALSQALYQFGDSKKKCVRESGVNVENLYPLPVGSCIYAPSVMFVRSDKKQNFCELSLDNRVVCDVISIASLDFTANHKQENHIRQYLTDDGRMTADGMCILKKALTRAFDYAMATNHDCIVLGAFGVGLHIPPADIGSVLSDVIRGYNGCFSRIVINEKRSRKLKPFYDNLSFDKE